MTFFRPSSSRQVRSILDITAKLAITINEFGQAPSTGNRIKGHVLLNGNPAMLRRLLVSRKAKNKCRIREE